MPSIIEALHRLQEIELDLAKIRQEEHVKQRRIIKYQRDLAKLEQQIAELDRHFKHTQATFDNLQLDIQTREGKISHHREALNQAKTNKEYAQILESLTLEKADVSKIEARGLELVAQTDQFKLRRDELETERQTLLQKIEELEQALRAYRDKTGSKRERLESKKAQASGDIPTASLQTFDRVAERHEGEAMAGAMKIHPRREEYCCSGCNMKLTLEMINALKIRAELQFCPSCGRILYIEG